MDEFFDFEFPWYSSDNTGLEDFKKLFLTKYYMYEIGQETPGMFKLYLQGRLMEKMPEWSELYKTTLMVYDPLVNRKITRTNEFNETDHTDSTTTTELESNTTFNTQRTDNGTFTDDTTSGSTTGTTESASSSGGSYEDNQSINSDNPQVTVSTSDYASTMQRGENEISKHDESTGKLDSTVTGHNNVTHENNNSVTGVDTTLRKDESQFQTFANTDTQRDGGDTETGYMGADMTANIVSFRGAILNLNLEICEYMRSLFMMFYN